MLWEIETGGNWVLLVKFAGQPEFWAFIFKKLVHKDGNKRNLFILAACFEIDVWKGIWEVKREAISMAFNPSFVFFRSYSLFWNCDRGSFAKPQIRQQINKTNEVFRCHVSRLFLSFCYAMVTSIRDQTIVFLAVIAIDFTTREPGNYSSLCKLAFFYVNIWWQMSFILNMVMIFFGVFFHKMQFS